MVKKYTLRELYEKFGQNCDIFDNKGCYSIQNEGSFIPWDKMRTNDCCTLIDYFEDNEEKLINILKNAPPIYEGNFYTNPIVKHKCKCDFYNVIVRYGCQCGGI